MSNVINRVTRQYLTSVDTVKYDIKDWIINPNIPKCDSKYWKIVGDSVLEMNVTEKLSVDTTISNLLSQKNELLKDITKADKLLKSLSLVLLDEINALRTKTGLSNRTIDQFKTAIITKYDSI